MRAFLVAFILFFALAIAGSAQRAQQGTIPPVAPLPTPAAAPAPAKDAVAPKDVAPKQTVEGFDSLVRPRG